MKWILVALAVALLAASASALNATPSDATQSVVIPSLGSSNTVSALEAFLVTPVSGVPIIFAVLVFLVAYGVRIVAGKGGRLGYAMLTVAAFLALWQLNFLITTLKGFGLIT